MNVVDAKIGRVEVRFHRTEWDESATDLRLRGFVFCDSVAHALAVRDALRATASAPDEPVVPIVAPSGPNGFYTVTGITAEVRGTWLEVEVQGTPIERPAFPQITSGITANVKVNDHNLLYAAPAFAVPADVTLWTWQPTGTAVTETRPTAPGPAAGDVLHRRVTAGTGQSVASWVCPPAAWYQGGCHAETYRADRWMPVVGRGLLEQPWQISNGLVRATLVEGGASTGRLRVQWWRPTAPTVDTEDSWTPVQEFGLGLGGGLDVSDWRSAEIVEQSPQRIKLRVHAERTAGRLTLWLTIRRGSRLVDCTVDTDVIPGHRLRALPAVGCTAAPAAGAGEGAAGWHAYRTAEVPSSGGLRWVFCAKDNFAIAAASSSFTPENALGAQWTFGINAYFTGAAGDSGDRVQAAREWFTARAEQVTIR